MSRSNGTNRRWLASLRSFWIGYGAQKLRRGDTKYLNALREGKTGASMRAGMRAAAGTRRFSKKRS